MIKSVSKMLITVNLKMRTPLGPEKSFLIREVSLFQGTLVLYWDTEKGPDYRGVLILRFLDSMTCSFCISVYLNEGGSQRVRICKDLLYLLINKNQRIRYYTRLLVYSACCIS